MRLSESEIVELKSTFGEWKEIIITLSAFSNKKGDTVIVGIDDSGQPLHMHIGSKTIEDFINKIKNHTDPVLYPSINVKTFGLGEIVELQSPNRITNLYLLLKKRGSEWVEAISNCLPTNFGN